MTNIKNYRSGKIRKITLDLLCLCLFMRSPIFVFCNYFICDCVFCFQFWDFSINNSYKTTITSFSSLSSFLFHGVHMKTRKLGISLVVSTWLASKWSESPWSVWMCLNRFPELYYCLPQGPKWPRFENTTSVDPVSLLFGHYVSPL